LFVWTRGPRQAGWLSLNSAFFDFYLKFDFQAFFTKSFFSTEVSMTINLSGFLPHGLQNFPIVYPWHCKCLILGTSESFLSGKIHLDCTFAASKLDFSGPVL
jgi:hypothetical protein